jgi:hypothetical protein
VRVATLNVWGRSGDWDARRELLARSFTASDHYGLLADLTPYR